MKNKKFILICFFGFVLMLSVSLCSYFFLESRLADHTENEKETEKNGEELPVIDDASELKNEDLMEEVIEESKSENLTEEKIEESEDNISNNDKIKNENNNSDKESNNQNISNTNEPVENPQDITSEEIIEKTVCADDDPGYQSFLSNYKSMYPTYFVFNSESEAIDFGEKAMTEFGYMYQRNSLPVIYNNDCTKEIWYVRLTITAKACTKDGVYNDVIHLPATAEVISKYDYLRNLGYDCGNKR